MTTPPQQHYALLIGINLYLPNDIQGKTYKSLRGCVKDVERVETFLRGRLPLPDANLIKLTATNAPTGGAVEPPEKRPTYANIVAAFKSLIERVNTGDFVYVHYSGHGGRAKTAYPAIKGPVYDETLVPMDIGQPGGQYLRDVELAHLISQLVAKGAILNVVLDCCHSGGMNRNGELPPEDEYTDLRGLDVADEADRPHQNLVADPDTLAATWQTLSPDNRNLISGMGGLPEPRGYALIAASQANQYAQEKTFPTVGLSGVLTHCLLTALTEAGQRVTVGQVFNRVTAEVQRINLAQNPQAFGELGRDMFGAAPMPFVYGVLVKQVEMPKNRVQLGAGQVHGIRNGAEFAIYPANATDLLAPEGRIARVQVTERGAVDSWAQLLDTPTTPLQPGMLARLTEPASKTLVRNVLLSPSPDPDSQKALDAVRDAFRIMVAPLLRLTETPGEAHFTVSAAGGQYTLSDGTGIPFPNLPKVAAGEGHAVIEQVMHLTQYQNVQALTNGEPRSPLRGKLKLELLGTQQFFEPSEPADPFPPSEIPTVKVGQWLIVQVTNTSNRPLNVTILALQPDWSIVQAFPRDGSNFETFDPNMPITLGFQVGLGEGVNEGVDILKVFATVEDTDFHWLELPPMGGETRNRAMRSSETRNMLEAVMVTLTDGVSAERNLGPAVVDASYEWTVSEASINVRR